MEDTNIIRCVRKGSVTLNEDDRQELGRLLLKAGYAVKISYRTVPGTERMSKPRKEHVIEYWEQPGRAELSSAPFCNKPVGDENVFLFVLNQ